jgi:hypothetical protein
VYTIHVGKRPTCRVKESLLTTRSLCPPVPPAQAGDGPFWIRCGDIQDGGPDLNVHITRYDNKVALECALTRMGLTDRMQAAGAVEFHGHRITWGRDPITWNRHSNDLGDWCPWSGEQVQGDDDRCPAGCRDSRPSAEDA